jgi:hypothetical protein
MIEEISAAAAVARWLLLGNLNKTAPSGRKYMQRFASAACALAVATAAFPATAIPVFARKYATSCQTCHTVYPKLTPFGEAFRRNGFRFPGTDSDYWKQDTVALQPKAGNSDPAVLSVIPPLSFGANGDAVVHPDKTASATVADANTRFSLADLVGEAHVWTGGSLSDRITYFGEVTFGSDGSLDLEHAQVYFNDLFGPQHAVNLRIGRGFNTISSFGPHSSYLSDTRGVSLAVAGLQGGSPSWNVLDHYNGLEATGVLGGRLDYAVGINAGTGSQLRNSENVYGHLGYKIGGMRLDGEGKTQTNPDRPWEETAFTLEAFAYHAYSATDFAGADEAGAPLTLTFDDTTNGGGGGVRAQWGSLELNAGAYFEHHTRVTPDFVAGAATGADAIAQYDELSYMVNSWLVPAVRFEYFSLSPDGAETQSLYRILPGVAMTVVPNVKLTVVAVIEGATGNPPGGWGQVGGSVAPTDSTSKLGPELEAVTLSAAIAF